MWHCLIWQIYAYLKQMITIIILVTMQIPVFSQFSGTQSISKSQNRWWYLPYGYTVKKCNLKKSVSFTHYITTNVSAIQNVHYMSLSKHWPGSLGQLVLKSVFTGFHRTTCIKAHSDMICGHVCMSINVVWSCAQVYDPLKMVTQEWLHYDGSHWDTYHNFCHFLMYF